MRYYNNNIKMNHKICQHRRSKRVNKKTLYSLYAVIALCLVLICSISYKAIKSNANNGYKYYTSISVQDGESLWSIASEYADKDHYKTVEKYVKEVININHLNEEGTILSGQTIIIPYYSNEFIF